MNNMDRQSEEDCGDLTEDNRSHIVAEAGEDVNISDSL